MNIPKDIMDLQQSITNISEQIDSKIFRLWAETLTTAGREIPNDDLRRIVHDLIDVVVMIHAISTRQIKITPEYKVKE
jgi:hypothetical protein